MQVEQKLYKGEQKKFFYLIFYFCEQGKWLPLQNEYFQEMQSLSIELKSNPECMYIFFFVRAVICTNSPPCSIIKLTACIKQ